MRTLLWALRNKSYSLKKRLRGIRASGKLDHKPTGKVDFEEIEYCTKGRASTVDLLNAAKQEFDLHPIAPGPDRMFSPASVAKSYLEELHILHPSEKVIDAECSLRHFHAELLRRTRGMPHSQLGSAGLPRGLHVAVSDRERTPGQLGVF